MTVRVAVVDDHWLYRNGIGAPGAALHADHEVHWRAADAEELMRLLGDSADRRCDVVVLDLRIVPTRAPDPTSPRPRPGEATAGRPVQGCAAIELVRRAAAELGVVGCRGNPPAVVVFTEVSETRVQLACYLSGASAVVHKHCDSTVLADAVAACAAGEVLISPEAAALAEELAERVDLNLTQAEAQVLALRAHGLSDKQIAGHLQNSTYTVSNHLRHIREKFGPDVPAHALADAFGLTDLAQPDRADGAPEFSRPRLKAFVQRLRQRRHDEPHGKNSP